MNIVVAVKEVLAVVVVVMVLVVVVVVVVVMVIVVSVRPSTAWTTPQSTSTRNLKHRQ